MKKISCSKRDLIKKIQKVFEDLAVRYFAVFILSLGTFWLLVNVVWTSVTIYNYYLDVKVLTRSKILLVLLFIIPFMITAFYVWAVYRIKKLSNEVRDNSEKFLQDSEIIQFYRNIIHDSFDDIYSKHKEILMKDIKNAIKKKNWDEAIRIGKFGSRLFLMLSRYDLRLEYGKYLIQAAKEKHDPDAEAIGYIDCIGWTYVRENDYERAKENINEGLRILSEDNYIMKCKAYRHLAGIALKQNDTEIALYNRDKFENNLRYLTRQQKKVMRASLHIIDGDICVHKNDYEAAKKHYKEAHALFEECSDFERLVKVNYKLGQVDERMNQKEKAIEHYMVGFWMADKIIRIDEKLKNCGAICHLFAENPDLPALIFSNAKLESQLKASNIIWEKSREYYDAELEQLKKKIHT